MRPPSNRCGGFERRVRHAFCSLSVAGILHPPQSGRQGIAVPARGNPERHVTLNEGESPQFLARDARAGLHKLAQIGDRPIGAK